MERQADIPIGQLSRRTACNIETIRYYERIGLLPKPERTGGRYRVYGADDVGRVTFIRRARELGFKLSDVRALIGLSATGGKSCSTVRELTARHLAEVRAKIADLESMERMLASTVRKCDAGRRTSCPLIDALSSTRR